MADTRNDVVIPVRTWTNLYTLSGIAPGTAVTVINKGSSHFFIAIRSSAPTAPASGQMPNVGWPVSVWPDMMAYANVPENASGLWVWSPSGGLALVQD